MKRLLGLALAVLVMAMAVPAFADVDVNVEINKDKDIWVKEFIFKLKVPIVSTTEELSYPWFSNRVLARKIDAAAKKAKVAVVGTGVNPGFAMDALPITLTGTFTRMALFISTSNRSAWRMSPLTGSS